MNRLSKESSQSELKSQTSTQVFNFGKRGLRTLVFAFREMSESEFSSIDWSNVADPEKLCEICEKELTILGCTGIVDELQDDVAECIE